MIDFNSILGFEGFADKIVFFRTELKRVPVSERTTRRIPSYYGVAQPIGKVQRLCPIKCSETGEIWGGTGQKITRISLNTLSRPRSRYIISVGYVVL
jgi:hypothetical protein